MSSAKSPQASPDRIPVSRQKRVLEILRRNNLRTDFLEKNLHSEELQQLNRLLTVVFENAGNNICKKYFLRIIQNMPHCFSLSLINDKCLTVVSTDPLPGDENDDRILFFLQEGLNTLFIQHNQIHPGSANSLYKIYIPVRGYEGALGYLLFDMGLNEQKQRDVMSH